MQATGLCRLAHHCCMVLSSLLLRITIELDVQKAYTQAGSPPSTSRWCMICKFCFTKAACSAMLFSGLQHLITSVAVSCKRYTDKQAICQHCLFCHTTKMLPVYGLQLWLLPTLHAMLCCCCASYCLWYDLLRLLGQWPQLCKLLSVVPLVGATGSLAIVQGGSARGDQSNLAFVECWFCAQPFWAKDHFPKGVKIGLLTTS